MQNNVCLHTHCLVFSEANGFLVAEDVTLKSLHHSDVKTACLEFIYTRHLCSKISLSGVIYIFVHLLFDAGCSPAGTCFLAR